MALPYGVPLIYVKVRDNVTLVCQFLAEESNIEWTRLSDQIILNEKAKVNPSVNEELDFFLLSVIIRMANITYKYEI